MISLIEWLNAHFPNTKQAIASMHLYVLDDQGEAVPADVETWVQWIGTHKTTMATDIVREALVSTVFLGIDANLGHGPPRLWETMVFGGPNDGDTQAWATRFEAIRGHDAFVRAEQARVLKEGGDVHAT